MNSELLLVFIIGGIVVLDTTPFFQSMISQPLVVCAFFGYIWGDIYIGAILGVILELIWLKLVPVGGFLSQQGNFGAFASSSSAVYVSKQFDIVHEETLIFVFILYSFLISLTASTLTYKIRVVNRKIIHFIDKKKINLLSKINYIQILTIFFSFLIGGLFLSISFIFGVEVVGRIISRLSLNFRSFAEVGIYSALGVGSGVVLSMFWEKKGNLAFYIGVAAGIVLVVFGFPL